MSHLPILFAFWGAFGLALLSPGPNFAVLLNTGLREGRLIALQVAAGFAIGEAFWGAAAVFGVAALVATHPALATLLRVGGGLYLLYLGLAALRSALTRHQGPAVAVKPVPAAPGRGVRRGLGLMLFNAKAGVFWLSLTSLIIGADAPLGVGLAAILGAVLMSLGWHTALALAFSGAAINRVYARVRRGLEATLGVVLAGLGLRMLTTN